MPHMLLGDADLVTAATTALTSLGTSVTALLVLGFTAITIPFIIAAKARRAAKSS